MEGRKPRRRLPARRSKRIGRISRELKKDCAEFCIGKFRKGKGGSCPQATGGGLCTHDFIMAKKEGGNLGKE